MMEVLVQLKAALLLYFNPGCVSEIALPAMNKAPSKLTSDGVSPRNATPSKYVQSTWKKGNKNSIINAQ